MAQGQQQSWKDVDTPAAAQSIIELPNAEINGTRMKCDYWRQKLKVEYERQCIVRSSGYPELKHEQTIDT